MQEAVDPEGLQKSQVQQLEMEEKELLFGILFANILKRDGKEKLFQSAGKVIEFGLELTAEERLLLKLCYQDGLSVTEAGRMLGMNRNQVHGRMRRLFARLRQEFEKMGLDNELLLLLREGE